MEKKAQTLCYQRKKDNKVNVFLQRLCAAWACLTKREFTLFFTKKSDIITRASLCSNSKAVLAVAKEDVNEIEAEKEILSYLKK
jgi:hypothetical protein